MKTFRIKIKDEDVYVIEAETEKDAKLQAEEWFHERVHPMEVKQITIKKKRKINLTLVDIYKPDENFGRYLIETTLSNEELQKYTNEHKENNNYYTSDSVLKAIKEHKDIKIIDCDFEDVELDF